MSGQRRPDGLAGVGVPQPHGLIAAAGNQPVPVGAERDTEHRGGMSGQRRPDGLASVGVPQPDGFVDTGGGQPVSVEAERDTEHRVGVPGQGVQELTGVGVPQPDGLVNTGGGQPAPVGADRRADEFGAGVDDFVGVGARVQRVQESGVVGPGCQRACGQHLRERPRITARPPSRPACRWPPNPAAGRWPGCAGGWLRGAAPRR